MSEGQRLLINIVMAIFFALMLTEIWSRFPEASHTIKTFCTIALTMGFLVGSDWVKHSESKYK